MKILFVTGTLTHGGAQRVISVVASRMSEMGHDVSMIVFKRFPEEYPLSGRVKVFSLADSEEEYKKISGAKRVFLLRRIIKGIHPDVAIGFLEGGYGMYLASLGMKMLRIASARVNPKSILEETGLRSIINRIWFRMADMVVLQTKGQIELLNGLCRKERCVVIPNPISDAYLSIEPHAYDRPVERIVMVGRLNEQKDYPTALEAMRIVNKVNPNITLDIVGEGDIRPELERLIVEKGLENTVRLVGWSNDVYRIEKGSDVFLMTSLYEGMPNALMEAMASGLICISTDCETGPADLIENGKNGFLVSLTDANAIAQRIIEIAEMSEEERRGFGDAARRYIVENYSSITIVKKWEQAILGLMAKMNRG